MILTILSDIHDNLKNLKKILNWTKLNNSVVMICCGDVCNSDTLGFLSRNYFGKIYMCQGNMELFEPDEPNNFSNIKDFGRSGGVIEIEQLKIGVCHEPRLVESIVSRNNCDIIFYGHTHVPWEDHKSGVRMVNPGNVAGIIHKATFASFDTETRNLRLYLLEKL